MGSVLYTNGRGDGKRDDRGMGGHDNPCQKKDDEESQ